MKKAELMEYGIPEAKIRAFNEVYWNDVRKQAARMVEEAKGQDAAPAASIRDAISAMLRVIDDPARLSMILTYTNRQHQYYLNDLNGVSNPQAANAQKQPETAQEEVKAEAHLARAERHFNFPSAVNVAPETGQGGAC